MNTTLSTAIGRHNHPPETALVARQVRRVGLIDRLALHLGVALVAWSRRPHTSESRERRANRVELELARLAREREAERGLRLSIPIR